jgi:uncharacterized RDD family membrane protein YckC
MEKYETLSKRFWAMVIDSLVLIPVHIVFTLGTAFIFKSETGLRVGSAITGLITVFYYILLHYRYGQTVGKKAVGVKVVDISETPLNFGQSVVRCLPQLIPVMFAVSFSNADQNDDLSLTIVSGLITGIATVFFIADVAVCLVSEKRRALHDLIAGTIVVRTDV